MADAPTPIHDHYRKGAYNGVLDAMRIINTGFMTLHTAMVKFGDEFVSLTQQERSEIRQAVLGARTEDQKKVGEIVDFSHLVITHQETETGVNLRWQIVDYARSGATGEPGHTIRADRGVLNRKRRKIMFNTPKKEGGNITKKALLDGAHEAEVDTLIHHNRQLKAIKEVWLRFGKMRSGFRMMQHALEKRPAPDSDE